MNGLNCPLKWHRLADWIQKLKPDICCIQESHLTLKDKHKLNVKGWSSILQINGKQKKAGIAILFADAIGFKPTKIRKDKDGHFIFVKCNTLYDEISIINIYAPNHNVPQFIRETLTDMSNSISSTSIVVGDFNTPLAVLDRSSKKKLSKEILDLNSTIQRLDLTDIYRTFHPKKN